MLRVLTVEQINENPMNMLCVPVVCRGILKERRGMIASDYGTRLKVIN